MKKTSQISQISLLTVLLIYPFSAYAGMYKWVDAEGNTQYTQQPPPDGINAENIKPPPEVDTESALKELKGDQDRADDYLKSKNEEKENAQKKGQEMAEQQALCEQAKARLASYERPRINVTDKDGTSRRASEEERLEGIKSSQELIKKLCK